MTDVKEIYVAVSLMHDTAVFYSDSAKRIQNLQEYIDRNCPENSCTCSENILQAGGSRNKMLC